MHYAPQRRACTLPNPTGSVLSFTKLETHQTAVACRPRPQNHPADPKTTIGLRAGPHDNGLVASLATEWSWRPPARHRGVLLALRSWSSGLPGGGPAVLGAVPRWFWSLQVREAQNVSEQTHREIVRYAHFCLKQSTTTVKEEPRMACEAPNR